MTEKKYIIRGLQMKGEMENKSGKLHESASLLLDETKAKAITVFALYEDGVIVIPIHKLYEENENSERVQDDFNLLKAFQSHASDIQQKMFFVSQATFSKIDENIKKAKESQEEELKANSKNKNKRKVNKKS